MESSFWDEKFKEDNLLYGKLPNEYFMESLKLLRPGYLLIPACGEGRDAVYAAKEGWKIVAVDYSKRALEKARELAIKENVAWDIEFIHADLSKWKPEAETFDAVALTFAHFIPEIRASVHQNLIDSLKPGGKVILEGFSKEQSGFNSGGPDDEEMLFSTEMIKDDFKNMTSGRVRKRTVNLYEGEGHTGKASVVRYFGSK